MAAKTRLVLVGCVLAMVGASAGSAYQGGGSARLVVGVVMGTKFFSFDAPDEGVQLSTESPASSTIEAGTIKLTNCENRALVVSGIPGVDPRFVASAFVVDEPSVTAAITL